MTLFTAIRVAAWMLYVDIIIFCKDWFNNILNSLCWPLVLIIVSGLVWPAMGMPDDYGAFMSIGMLILIAFFTAWDDSRIFVADLEGTRSISYELTLPTYYWLVCLRTIIHYALKSALFNIQILVVGKLILWDKFDFSNFNLFQFIVVYLLSTLLFGAIGVWAAVLAGSVKRFTHLDLRLIGPLMFVCGQAFPWSILNTLSPIIGKIILFTPTIYAYEGARAAILGQGEYLNYWLCIGMLAIFIVIFCGWGLYLFKRRLDCV